MRNFHSVKCIDSWGASSLERVNGGHLPLWILKRVLGLISGFIMPFGGSPTLDARVCTKCCSSSKKSLHNSSFCLVSISPLLLLSVSLVGCAFRFEFRFESDNCSIRSSAKRFMIEAALTFRFRSFKCSSPFAAELLPKESRYCNNN